MGVKEDYNNALYDVDDDATVAEFCLQERFRGKVKDREKDIAKELDLLDEENDEN